MIISEPLKKTEEQLFLYEIRTIHAFTKNKLKNHQNIKKRVQISNLEAFFGV